MRLRLLLPALLTLGACSIPLDPRTTPPASNEKFHVAPTGSKISVVSLSLTSISPLRQLRGDKRYFVGVMAQVSGTKDVQGTVECDVAGHRGYASGTIRAKYSSLLSIAFDVDTLESTPHGMLAVKCVVTPDGGIPRERTDTVKIHKLAIPNEKLVLYRILPQYAYDCKSKAAAVENRPACVGLEIDAFDSNARASCSLDGAILENKPGYSSGGGLILGALAAGKHELACAVKPRSRWDNVDNQKFSMMFTVEPKEAWRANLTITTKRSKIEKVSQIYPGRGDSPTYHQADSFFVSVRNDGPQAVPMIRVKCGPYSGVWSGSTEAARSRDPDTKFAPLAPGQQAEIQVATHIVPDHRGGALPQPQATQKRVTCRASADIPGVENSGVVSLVR